MKKWDLSVHYMKAKQYRVDVDNSVCPIVVSITQSRRRPSLNILELFVLVT